MCGIAVVVSLNGVKSNLGETVARMCETLKHRGPNDEGYSLVGNSGVNRYFGDSTPHSVRDNLGLRVHVRHSSSEASRVALGHRRLSILDLSAAGHQPMSRANARYTLVFNGEIYNYLELRSELESRGEQFVTQSDTEVILAAYAAWGSDCFGRFNGDWAIVIYDREADEIVIARDRFGIKPLYVASLGDRFLIASEISAIRSVAPASFTVAMQEVSNYLREGDSEWRSETMYAGIYRFPKAHFVRAERTKVAAELPKKYWSCQPNLAKETFDPTVARQLARRYRELLTDAVRLRLRSDVVLGAALSGGIDSSSIVCTMHGLTGGRLAGRPLLSFSTVHPNPRDRRIDESSYIELVANRFQLESHRIAPDERTVPEQIEAVVRHWESPPDGMGIAGISTFALARSVGCVVTLDGQGADEVWAGYDGYLRGYLNSTPLRALPEAIRSLGLRRPPLKSLLLGLAERSLRAGVGGQVAERLLGALGRRPSGELNQELLTSVDEGLVNLIHYADARSMMYSIESRMPFMDHRLIEFGLSVPACYKIHDGYTKYLPRLAFEGDLPPEILWRRDKVGWAMPEQEWLSGALRSWAENEVQGSELARRFLSGRKFSALSGRLRVRFLMLAVWERVVVRAA